MIALLNWGLEHWFLIFFLAIFGFFGWVRDFAVGTVKAIASVGERRHQRRMEELELRARISAGAATAEHQAVKPGPCVHRNVTAVVGTDDTVKAWLCKTCDAQLPADWAVREEDLAGPLRAGDPQEQIERDPDLWQLPENVEEAVQEQLEANGG